MCSLHNDAFLIFNILCVLVRVALIPELKTSLCLDTSLIPYSLDKKYPARITPLRCSGVDLMTCLTIFCVEVSQVQVDIFFLWESCPICVSFWWNSAILTELIKCSDACQINWVAQKHSVIGDLKVVCIETLAWNLFDKLPSTQHAHPAVVDSIYWSQVFSLHLIWASFFA